MNTGPAGHSSQEAFQRLTLQAPYKDLVKPHQIKTVTFLDEEKQSQIAAGIGKLWDAIRMKPVEDVSHQQAISKLKEMTKSFVNQVQKQNADRAAAQSNAQRPTSQGQHQSQTTTDAIQPHQPQQQQQQSGSQNKQEIPEQFSQQAERLKWAVPSGVSNAQLYLEDLKRRYASQLYAQEKAKAHLARIEQHIQQQSAQGKPIIPQWTHARQQYEHTVNSSTQWIENLLKQQNELRSRQTGNVGSGQNMQTQSASNLQHAQPGGNTVRPLPQNTQQVNRPGSSSMPGQPPQLGTQQNNSSSSQPSQVNTMGISRQPNPASAGGFTQSPQSTLPQSTNSQQQAPVAYTHQSAMDAVSRSYSSGGNQQHSAPSSAVGGQSSSTQSFNRPEVEKQISSNRWPISKPFAPPTPQAVQMPPARPTLTGSGVMGQPAIQQAPAFNLHGPGDRVLDKKKLDELVRQVCGGSGQSLHPEVEESVLQLADEFFDNVVSNACRLAKLRGSSTLEIRDIQLILQRQYNIRIPGYATDEIRTVRKVQPTASYLQKLNAVQAAKVMGGKGDI